MAATPSVKVSKTFFFKGGTKRFSNRYHFNGGTPGSGAAWDTLFDNVVAAEKAIYNSHTTIVECTGYAAGSDVPVRSKTYSQAGTGSFSGNACPGECVALARWATAARTSKNHPIYLFNYWHGVLVGTAWNTAEYVVDAQRAAMGTYGAAWLSGFSDGSHTLVRAGPNGVSASGVFIEEFVTHRDFPYSPSA